MAYSYRNVLRSLQEEKKKKEAQVYVVENEYGKKVNQDLVKRDKVLSQVKAEATMPNIPTLSSVQEKTNNKWYQKGAIGTMLGMDKKGALEIYTGDSAWYKKILQVPEVFKDNTNMAKNLLSDGFQLTDAYKMSKEIGKDTALTIGGTVGDAGLGVAKGIANVGEGIGDLATYGIAQGYEWAGNKERADQLRRNASEDTINKLFEKPQSYVNKASIVGDTGDKVSEGIGYMASIWASGTVGGAAGGAIGATDKAAKIGSTVGQSGLIFSNSAGTNMADIYQEYGTEGVKSGEAWAKSLGSAAIETVTEQLFGMFGKADTRVINAMTAKATSGIGKALTRAGGQAAGEGLEEIISYAGNHVWDRVVDAASKGEGAKFAQEWNWEDMWEQAGIAAITALTMSGGQTSASALNNKNSNNTWKDAINETARQQDVQAQIEELEDQKAKLDEKMGQKGLTQAQIDSTLNEMQQVEQQISELQTQGQIAPINTSVQGEQLTQEQYINELDSLQREYLQAPDAHAQTVLQQQIDELQAQAEQKNTIENNKKYETVYGDNGKQYQRKIVREFKDQSGNEFRIYKLPNNHNELVIKENGQAGARTIRASQSEITKEIQKYWKGKGTFTEISTTQDLAEQQTEQVTEQVDEQVQPDTPTQQETMLQDKYKNYNLNEDISDMNGIPAIELSDGSIVPIKDGSPHVSFIKNSGIDVNDIKSGGWITNGDYESTYRSHTVEYVEREKARQRIEEKKAKIRAEQQTTIPTQEEITNLLDIQKNKSGSEYASAFFALRDKYGQVELYKALNEQYSKEKNVQQDTTEQIEQTIEEAIAPLQETVEKLTEQVQEKIEGITEQLNTVVNSIEEIQAPVSQEVVERQNQEAFETITDEQAPIDVDNMSFEDAVDEMMWNVESEATTESKVESPFDERDIDEVGKRNVKAYQYENPEVRPYFQTEAENMLYDLDNTIKGEKIAIKDQEGYITDWAGITRQTTEAIAYLKDNYGYSYDQIRKGLNAIIEDDGKENNAVSKRIEFMLDERLREGYITSDGIPIPPNQEYINFLGEKNITEYNQKISEHLAISDQYTPTNNIQENSLQNMENMIEFNNGVSDSNFITVAPYYNTQLTNENYEAIKNAVDRDFKAAANKFSSLFGAKIEKVDTNIGGFTFQEGETAGQFVKELSYTFELKNVSAEDSDMIASLLGDLGHEQQEAVISANYLDSTSNEADALEFRIKVNDSVGVEEALSKAGINDYTIDKTDNTIKILEFDIDNPGSTIERLKLLVSELGGNYNGTEESKIQSRYLDREARRSLYQSRLAANEANQQNRELNNYISEALRKIEGKTNKELDNSSFSFGEISPTREIVQDIPMYEKIEARELPISPQIEKSNETIPMKRITAENQNTGVTEAKVRKWAETSTESEILRDEIAFSDLDIEKVMYQPITNKGTLNKANDKLGTLGYNESVKYFNSQIVNKKVSVEDIALGERLIQEAIKQGDKTTAAELIQNVAILGTELGQKVQALSIIQRMTPAGQLKMLDKTINRGKVKEDKAFKGVELTQEMKDKILSVYNEDGTYDQDELNRVIDEVKQEIADSMPVTAMDKINAWRYFSMLGNPKTHIRNLVSNVAMKGTLGVKNAVARTIETIAPIENKTKTWRTSSQEVKDFAKQTTIEMKDIISDGSKYSETADIKARRDTFKNKVLNKLVNFNSDLLEKEDWWFSKGAFESSFSEFLTANGIKTQEDIQNNPELIEKGKVYATEQAQIATFRQYSWLSNKIRDIENKNAATQIAVGSILPFKRTPINIAKAGISYSPIGALKSLTYDLYQVKQGKMEASTAIDHIAQGATGTALTLIGYLLAQAGILNGAGDDDKEGKYDYQLGKQAYSLNIGGNTYSLSWLSPVAMPLFVGANSYEQLVEGEEWNADVVLETLGQTLDPLSEMSFLSSLDSVLSSYDTGTQRFFGIGEAMIQNYSTQFIPTASSQLAATLDDTKRTTKVSGDSNMKLLEETYNKMIYKIPGLRETLEPTTDIWGNEVKQSENLLKRTFENFISPYARKESIATEIDEELKDLYSQTGDNGILPSIPYNYINYNGEKYKMSAEEYTEYKKTYGQTANDLLEDLFRTTTYKNASSEDRTDMVNKVYDYARDEANLEYLNKEGVSYTNAKEDDKEYYKENDVKGAIDNDMSIEEYRLYTDDPEEYNFLKDKDSSYRRKYFDTNNSLKEIEKSFEEQKEGIDDDDQLDALSSEKKTSIINSIVNSGLDDTEKASLYKKYYNSDTVDTIAKLGIGVDDFLIYETMEFKADKNSKGNSIPGSRKDKVINYVNSLELNIPQKAIIIKSTNTFKFNDYNEEIVQYVSGLDLTYEEKTSVLENLGMTVKNGRVYWE